jgi:7,8-dihydropterin-6-yl-methyl-4-(beta-D-ribofuranosyl)aminobenzene 5'-phosphate synthase
LYPSRFVDGSELLSVLSRLSYAEVPYTEEELTDFTKRLKNELGVTQVAPAHCTGHLAFKVLMSAYGSNFIRAGLGSEIHF